VVVGTGGTFPSNRIKSHGRDGQTVYILPINGPEDSIVTFVKEAPTLSGRLAGSGATNGTRFLFLFFVSENRVINL
jgi:hypothetical protein